MASSISKWSLVKEGLRNRQKGLLTAQVATGGSILRLREDIKL
ncbi:hypothetical protein F444_22921 [Phytophthora nicotianae P1976]|uniref:Uncharacterized protein n=1 Tax=Phytophthora nicotianae P1976 TaxID=1317066 RepID=A0A080YWD8_PHYNI|nr:hypothetical protein F444_22921 [Phytophthora nicotianae P1976]